MFDSTEIDDKIFLLSGGCSLLSERLSYETFSERSERPRESILQPLVLVLFLMFSDALVTMDLLSFDEISEYLRNPFGTIFEV